MAVIFLSSSAEEQKQNTLILGFQNKPFFLPNRICHSESSACKSVNDVTYY